MSNVPLARNMLQEVLDWELDEPVRDYLEQIQRLLYREKPAFRAKPHYRSLTDEQRDLAKTLRSQGHSMNDIARTLNTNLGRVSEALNG